MNIKKAWWLLNGSGQSAPTFSLSKLTVKYKATDFAYPASFGWSDLGTPVANSRLIEGCTICTDTHTAQTNFNTGLAYDVAGDRFISKNYIPKTDEFFTRAAIKTACAAAVGTIPTPALSVIGTGQQGIAHDPVNLIIFEFFSETSIREYNYSGTLIANLTTDLPLATYDAGTLWYDYTTRIMYFSGGVGGDVAVKALRKNAGGTAWETIETKWYNTLEGLGGFPAQLIANVFTSASIPKWRTQDLDGFNVRIQPLPVLGIFQEGVLIDPRDLTLWVNDDSGGHGPITNGNRLLHCDHPNGHYLKYHRYPNMFSWSDCKLGSNSVTGSFFTDQALTGNDWTTLPVIDYVANTAQQTFANWEVGEGEAAQLEFRGSASAPTTSPIATKDYHTLREYDPNGSNDGWGATVPGAWQATPTTDRYMQVRVKPIAPTPVWTPADLGSDLISWFEQNSIDGLYYDAADSDRCEISINYADPSKNMSVSAATQKPIWNVAGTYLDMLALNRHYQFSAGLTSQLLALSECEIHAVARKELNTSRVIFIGISQLSTNNNQLRCEWLPSNVAPNNYISIRFIDAAGTLNVYGVADTTVAAWKMYSFRLGVGGSNKIYVNNVEQALTVNAGGNTGQCFDDIPLADTGRLARISATTSVAAVQRQRGLIITRPLSDANRALLMTYMQSISMID